MNISTNNNIRPDDWSDLIKDDITNIRVNGTYPYYKCKKRCSHFDKHQHLRMHDSPFLLNQHKPYGISTVHLLDPFDDRPDWWRFVKNRKRRQYEEIIPEDCEDFERSMEQDHEMHIPHNHVHIKQIHVKPNKADEIENVEEF